MTPVKKLCITGETPLQKGIDRTGAVLAVILVSVVDKARASQEQRSSGRPGQERRRQGSIKMIKNEDKISQFCANVCTKVDFGGRKEDRIPTYIPVGGAGGISCR